MMKQYKIKLHNARFQKIFIPIPRKVDIGNSEGKERGRGSQEPIVLRKVKLNWNFQGVGVWIFSGTTQSMLFLSMIAQNLP